MIRREATKETTAEAEAETEAEAEAVIGFEHKIKMLYRKRNVRKRAASGQEEM